MKKKKFTLKSYLMMGLYFMISFTYGQFTTIIYENTKSLFIYGLLCAGIIPISIISIHQILKASDMTYKLKLGK